jgi:hypothetical protein
MIERLVHHAESLALKTRGYRVRDRDLVPATDRSARRPAVAGSPPG